MSPDVAAAKLGLPLFRMLDRIPSFPGDFPLHYWFLLGFVEYLVPA